MSNIVSLNVARELKKATEGDPAYKAKILAMGKLELLDEMMRFQEERSQAPRLTWKMMIQGQILFKALEDSAETEELRSLARSYRRHLKFELEEYIKSHAPPKEQSN